MKTPGKILLGIAALLVVVSFVSCSISFDKSSKLPASERFASAEFRNPDGGDGEFMLGLAALVVAGISALISCGFIKDEVLQKWNTSNSVQLLPRVAGRRRGSRKGKSTISILKKAYKANLREPMAPRRRRSKKKYW